MVNPARLLRLVRMTVHIHIENETVYPVRRLLPDLEDDVPESYEGHRVADVRSMGCSGCLPTLSVSRRGRLCSSRTRLTISPQRKTGGSRSPTRPGP